MPWTRILVIRRGTTCSNDPSGVGNAGPVVDCGPEVTSVRATVSAGLPPSFDWSPRYRVTLLLIEDGNHDTWSLRGDEDQNDVAPPVTYGVVPPGLLGGTPGTSSRRPYVRGILWHAVNQSERILALHEFTREGTSAQVCRARRRGSVSVAVCIRRSSLLGRTGASRSGR